MKGQSKQSMKIAMVAACLDSSAKLMVKTGYDSFQINDWYDHAK